MTEDEELIGLSWYDAGVRNFYSTGKPITCLEDMEGMRIRVQESEMMADTIEALGAEAVQLDYEKIYSAFERGHIDAAENNWPSYNSMQHYEVAKYYSIDEHTRVPELQLCSAHTWKVLSEEDRQIILECAKESALYERQLWVEYEETARTSALAQGTEVTVLSTEEKGRFREAVQPIYEKYCGEYMDIIEQIKQLSGPVMAKHPIQQIILTGGGSETSGVIEFIENAFSLPTTSQHFDASVRALSDHIWNLESAHRNAYIARREKIKNFFSRECRVCICG